MAVTFDAVATGGQGGTNTLTYSHTVAVQDNRVLIVGVSTEDPLAEVADTVVTGITYNAVALTKIDAQNVDDGITLNRADLWYLLAPATGAHNVVVSWAGNVNGGQAASLSYYGAKQAAYNVKALNSGTDAEPTTSITPTVSNTLIVDVVSVGTQSRTLTLDSGTQRANFDNGAVSKEGMSEIAQGAAATTTRDWSLSGTSRWATVAAALIPAPSGFMSFF